ncbi:hypothetical protein [Sinorhizobium americanum]|uniref:Uncharacterized protein n=1 Tax=Sinorhizobium americanum TaxID=194963 RepID=A0A4R2BW92_9HYPH|nr:hypothetical protein [Sinorhizobium americanum]TCN30304.1 hypothetical protein EV184_108178 [Sinorhizobium americanum]
MNTSLFGFETIYGANGERATPYLTRLWIGRLRLHIFHRGDADPDPHDHPWDFWTFPLVPYVEEVVTENRLNPGSFLRRRQVVRALRFHHRPASHTHRVIGRFDGWWRGYEGMIYPSPYPSIEPLHDFDEPQTDDGRIVTLVWRGKGERSWGLLKERKDRWCWMPWKEYVFGGGKHAPCAPVDAADAGAVVAFVAKKRKRDKAATAGGR